MDAVYGLHNWPGMPVGTIGIRSGPMMASADILDIEIKGKGGHGAIPHLSIDRSSSPHTLSPPADVGEPLDGPTPIVGSQYYGDRRR